MIIELSEVSGSPTATGELRVIPLTDSQRVFWADGAVRAGTAPGIRKARIAKLTGPYIHEDLREAVLAVVGRHEALRARVSADGESLVISPRASLDVPLVDFSHRSGSERDRETRRTLEALTAETFEAQDAPWFRAVTIKLEAECHLLVLTAHRALVDGVSFRILLDELCAFYQRLALVTIPMQLGEYLQRQAYLPDADDELFWSGQFADEPPRLELPRDHPQRRSFTGGEVTGELDAATWRKLTAVAGAVGSSHDALLLGAFTVLLGRLSGQEDVIVGATFLSEVRRLDGGSSLVGNTARVLPVRTPVRLDAPFRDHLTQMQARLSETATHREYLLGRPGEQLNLAPRSSAFHPLFSVQFDFDGDDSHWQAGDLKLELLAGGDPSSAPAATLGSELMLEVTCRDSGVAFRMGYAANLFEPETVRRWLGYYQRLLHGIAANPDQRISELPLLHETERVQILSEWNATTRDYPGADRATLHGMIEAQVARTPAAVAVNCDAESLTYDELNARANRLSHRLRRLEAGPGSIVGILAERSLEMVVGLTAILKAGAAYLPLDPNQPSERLGLMLQDAQPTVVLAQLSLRSRVSAGRHHLLILEEDLTSEPSDNPSGGAEPESLAYVIYTSGSTGVPKGVMNTHRGICNFMFWLQEAFQLGPADCILQKTAFTFDVSLAEIFGALTTGARLVMARPGLQGDTQYLAETSAEYNVTALWFVTPVLAAILHEPALRSCASLRHVTTGGEALTYDVIDRFSQVLPQAQLHNFYGPTETVVAVTAWACQAGSEDPSVPIGYPIANTQTYILDRALQPVPVGATGELHVGGKQVGRGYLNRPELTAEKFIPNPFGEGCLYKTGDLCRYRHNGAIEFLGRLDHQVKIRGFRIELGEIEALLHLHPAVHDAVVVTREQGSGERHLVAYVTGNAVELHPAALRAFLAEKLPGHMVPVAIVVLDKMPLTSNGKVDRRALPAPAAMPGKETVAPRNATEAKLTGIWEEVLGVKAIGVTDHFFELGGSSLAAARVFIEVRRVFGSNLPLATLFQASTIEQLARKLANPNLDPEWAHVVALQPNGSRPPFFGIHGRDGNVLFYRKLAQQLGPEQPFYAIQSQGLDGRPATYTSVEKIACFYVEQIRHLRPHGPYLLGGYSFGGLIAYEMAQRLRLANEEVPMVFMFDTPNPVHMARSRASYRKILERALRNPAALTSPHHILQFLARRVGGRAGEALLRFNESFYRWTKWTPRGSDNDVLNPTDLHVRMVHERASLNYRPPPYAGKVTLFRATAAVEGTEAPPDHGWRELVGNNLEVYDITATHSDLFSEENADFLAEQLTVCIEAALSPYQPVETGEQVSR